MAKRAREMPQVEIELTPGYEQRFTEAILKIFSNREKKEAEARNLKKDSCYEEAG